jgi:hypothetical protein
LPFRGHLALLPLDNQPSRIERCFHFGWNILLSLIRNGRASTWPPQN